MEKDMQPSVNIRMNWKVIKLNDIIETLDTIMNSVDKMA